MSEAMWNAETSLGTGVVLGRVEYADENGDLRVRLPGHGVLRAEHVTSVTRTALIEAAGTTTTVVCAFVDGETVRPIVVGLVAGTTEPRDDSSDETTVTVDGKRVEITGREEVTLRCGKASITLTKAGKVIVRGTYLSSRSSGVNRVKGGSVQIN